MTVRYKLKDLNGSYYHGGYGIMNDETCEFDLWKTY